MSYEYVSDRLSEMKGARLLAVLRDGDIFAFKTDKGVFGFGVVGGCCSRSFVEDIDIAPGIMGALIVDAKQADIDTPAGTDLSKYDCLQCYNLRVSTTLGDVVVDFRNDSNGHYGGNLTVERISPRILLGMTTLAEIANE